MRYGAYCMKAESRLFISDDFIVCWKKPTRILGRVGDVKSYSVSNRNTVVCRYSSPGRSRQDGKSGCEGVSG